MVYTGTAEFEIFIVADCALPGSHSRRGRTASIKKFRRAARRRTGPAARAGCSQPRPDSPARDVVASGLQQPQPARRHPPPALPPALPPPPQACATASPPLLLPAALRAASRCSTPPLRLRPRGPPASVRSARTRLLGHPTGSHASAAQHANPPCPQRSPRRPVSTALLPCRLAPARHASSLALGLMERVHRAILRVLIRREHHVNVP